MASFTLNHVVRLRWIAGKRAQYKVFVKGRELDGPVGMAVEGTASLYVASFTNDVVLRVNATDGELISRIGNEDSLDCPEGIAIGPDGKLYVASFLLPHLSVFVPESGEYLGRFGFLAPPSRSLTEPPPPLPRTPKPPQLAGAEDLAFDLNGDVHVTGYYSNAVFKFNGTSGDIVLTYGKGLVHGPVGIACDSLSGDLFVASYKDNKVLRFTSEGRFLGVAAGAELTHAEAGGEATAATSSRAAVSARADDQQPERLGVCRRWSSAASHATGAVTRFNSSNFGGRVWRVTD